MMWYSLPALLIAAALLVPLVGILQLRQEQRLRERPFGELLKIVLAQLPLIGWGNKAKNED